MNLTTMTGLNMADTVAVQRPKMLGDLEIYTMVRSGDNFYVVTGPGSRRDEVAFRKVAHIVNEQMVYCLHESSCEYVSCLTFLEKIDGTWTAPILQ